MLLRRCFVQQQQSTPLASCPSKLLPLQPSFPKRAAPYITTLPPHFCPLQAAKNPNNTVYDVKRLIGRKYDDAEVQEDLRTWPFSVTEGEGGKPEIEGKKTLAV